MIMARVTILEGTPEEIQKLISSIPSDRYAKEELKPEDSINDGQANYDLDRDC